MKKSTPHQAPISPDDQNETSDSYFLVVLQLNKDWRIIEGKCGLQWILQRRKSGRASRWQARAYFRTKPALIAACSKHAGLPGLTIAEQLAFLPELFGRAE